VSLAVAVVCVRLGFWQLGRLRERKAFNAAAYARRTLPELTLPGPHADVDERRVAATGTYDPAYDFVIRGREYREAPGVEIVTPLRVEGSDTALLVLRGFVSAGDALTARPDTLAEPGAHTVHGIALDLPAAPDRGDPRTVDGRETWRRFDLAMATRLPYPVFPVILIQSADSTTPRWPRRLDPPVLDEGPHLSYAIQWFAFAVIFGVGGVVFVRRRETGGGRRETGEGNKATGGMR
jgi:surfeit locus 1 family protein